MAGLGVFARLGEETVAVEVSCDATVQDLMDAVGKAFGQPPQPLRFQGDELKPDSMVADTGISSECTVHVDDGIIFTHEEPFDENGLIFYLGSLGRKEAFKNPDSKRRLVKCNKEPAWGEAASRWVGRSDHYGRTDQVTEPFFEVDLRVASICPTHYSLCFGRDCFDYLLKSWILKGSNDGKQWDEVDKRIDDPTFRDGSQGGRKPYHHGTWEISGAQAAYRMFRVVGLGNWDSDSEDGQTFLHLCKIELYGVARFQSDWQEDMYDEKNAQGDADSENGRYLE